MSNKIGIFPMGYELVNPFGSDYSSRSPAMMAEAMIGLLPLKVVRDAFRRRHPDIKFRDLEEALIRSTKKSRNLVAQEAFRKGSYTAKAVYTAKIKSRTRGNLKDKKTNQDVTVRNVDTDRIARFIPDCSCLDSLMQGSRRQLWREDNPKERKHLDNMVDAMLMNVEERDSILHTSCYHTEAAIARLYLQTRYHGEDLLFGNEYSNIPDDLRIELPFDFLENLDIAIDCMVKKYMEKMSYAQIDKFILDNVSMNPFFEDLVKQKKIRKEVIMLTRHFEHNDFLMNIDWWLREEGYQFTGFTRELTGVKNKKKDYETIGISYQRNNKTVVILYDNNFHIPFLLEKRPGKESTQTYLRNPVRILARTLKYNSPVWRHGVDDASMNPVLFTVKRPLQALREKYGLERKYTRYIASFAV